MLLAGLALALPPLVLGVDSVGVLWRISASVSLLPYMGFVLAPPPVDRSQLLRQNAYRGTRSGIPPLPTAIPPRPVHAHRQSHDEAASLLDGPSSPGPDAGPACPVAYRASFIF
jgi:hypothetical protein